MLGLPRLLPPSLGFLLALAFASKADEPVEPPKPADDSPAREAKAEPEAEVLDPDKADDELIRSPFDDPLRIFVPQQPRTTEDRDRLEALRFYVSARALEDQRQWNEAIGLLEQALEIEPESVPILRRLGRLYFALGQFEPAVETSRKVLAEDPADPDTIRRLVRYYRVQSNDPAAAEAFLKEILEHPDLVEGSATQMLVLHDLGLLYAEAEEYEKAVEPLAELVTFLDDKAANQLTLGDLNLILGENEAASYRRFGEIFYNASRYDLAITAFQRSLSYDPDSLQTPIYLAQAMLRNGQPERAYAVLDPIIADRPPGRVAFDVLAQILEALNREDELIPRLEAAVKADPDNVLLQYALAERFEEEGEVEKARDLYRKVIAQQPDDQGIAALAGSLLDQEKYEELLQLLETVWKQPGARAALDPQIKLMSTQPELVDQLLDAGLELLKQDPPGLSSDGRLLLVALAAQAERVDKLVALDRLNLEQNPGRQSFLELANTLSLAGQYDEAADTLQELIDNEPQLGQDSQLLAQLGYLRFQAGQSEDALEIARDLLEQNPDDFVALELVGFALSRLGRYEEAIEHCESVLERYADNPEAIKLARVWLSEVYLNMGDSEKAEDQLELLLEEDPDDPLANNNLGYFWAERGERLEEAKEMIAKAVAAEPENGSYLDSLGWVHYQLGEIDEAVHYLERAARVKPNDVTILDHLGDAYYRAGDMEKARATWSKAATQAESSDPPNALLTDIRKKLEDLDSQKPASNHSDDNP